MEDVQLVDLIVLLVRVIMYVKVVILDTIMML